MAYDLNATKDLYETLMRAIGELDADMTIASTHPQLPSPLGWELRGYAEILSRTSRDIKRHRKRTIRAYGRTATPPMLPENRLKESSTVMNTQEEVCRS